MPIFDTPGSISVTLELGVVGELRITAGDRVDTIVEVRPSDPGDESDVDAARQIRVDYTDGTLQIIGPRRMLDFSRKTRSVDVSIELPGDSRVTGNLWMGDVRCAGPLGEFRLKTTGNVRMERSGPLRLHTGMGSVTVGRVTGAADVSTANGKVQLGAVDGAAEVKSANGDIAIESVTGDVRVRTANGAIEVERAGAGVDVKSSNGAIRLGEVVRGTVVLGTAAGDLDIGIADGTAAWLELNTAFGHVRNLMDKAVKPDETDRTVEVRGRTSYGDITIHRS
jgi:hypothetical protein